MDLFFPTQQPLHPFPGCSPGTHSFEGPIPCPFFSYDFKEVDHLQTNKTQFPRVLFFLFERIEKGKSPLFQIGWSLQPTRGPKERRAGLGVGPAQGPWSGDGEAVKADDIRPSGSTGLCQSPPGLIRFDSQHIPFTRSQCTWVSQQQLKPQATKES